MTSLLNPKARHLLLASVAILCVYAWTNNNGKPLLTQIHQDQTVTGLVALVGCAGILTVKRGQNDA